MHMQIMLPYGASHLPFFWTEHDRVRVVEARRWNREQTEEALVNAALDAPYGGIRLERMARGKRSAVIITSDHTRPVPSRLTLPLILARLREGAPEIEITILIATGCHRASTGAELLEKFGEKIVRRERIVQHDCDDEKNLAPLCTLPSGGALMVNRAVVETELLVAEGFIEPHFFAGFSGGRKSVLPGVASRGAVMYNHNAGFIANEHARAGELERNPIHRDMRYAADAAGLRFILNVILDGEKRVVAAYAGDPETAHTAGCEELARHAGINCPQTPIVVTTNGGYPLDQNIYQCVKGLCTAQSICEPGGVIIMAAACRDGHGGDEFYNVLRLAKSPAELHDRLLRVPPGQTTPDQWQYQILARILCSHTVIFVTDPRLASVVTDMHMLYAPNLERAMELAHRIKGQGVAVTVLPDGVSVFFAP
ncbi:MAG: nickel-dependent lactate racemase [Christensenellaceae bacterium]|jgi:nickel-dependent lactate racemase|nr:nickel-dependent lactate racemase [Christensenellaceae bacterium]